MKILYRGVCAILAALVFPAVYFMEFIYFQLGTTLTEKYAMEDNLTLKRIIDIFTGNDPLSTFLPKDQGFTWPEALNPIKPHLIAMAILLVLTLLTALFLVVWSIASGKRVPILIASGVGIAFMIALSVVFSRTAAHLVAGGDIGVMSLFGSGGILASLVSGLVELPVLRIGNFRNAIVILFSVIIAWTLTFMAVDLGDPEAEAEKAKNANRKKKKKKA